MNITIKKKKTSLYYFSKLFHKNFYIYLNTNKPTKTFFNEISKIVPKNAGRKILLTSEHNDIDYKEFDEVLCRSKIEHIFSMGKFDSYFKESKYNNLLLKHLETFEKIRNFLLEFAGSDDIIFIHDTQNYGLSSILNYINTFDGSYVTEQLPKEEFFSLGRKLDIKDIVNYKEKLNKTDNLHWGYYFPYLFFFSKSGYSDFIVDEIDGSIVIYLLSHADDKYLFLYFPPIPMNKNSLKKVKEKLYSLLSNKKTTVLWLDENSKSDIEKEYKLEEKLEEYIYNYDKVKSLEGSSLKNLRYNLKRFKKQNKYIVRDYEINDYFECIKVLQKCSSIQDKKYNRVYDDTYNRDCLRFAHRFDKKDLFGKVVVIDGEIVAFGFAGEIKKDLANIFILKADPTIRGVSYFLKYEIIKELKEYKYINDSSALNNKGLKDAKESFNPVKKLKVYVGKE